MICISLSLELKRQDLESGQGGNCLVSSVTFQSVWDRRINAENDGDDARLSGNHVTTEAEDELRIYRRPCDSRQVEAKVDVLNIVWSDWGHQARGRDSSI